VICPDCEQEIDCQLLPEWCDFVEEHGRCQACQWEYDVQRQIERMLKGDEAHGTEIQTGNEGAG
jgi:hypothetical protein